VGLIVQIIDSFVKLKCGKIKKAGNKNYAKGIGLLFNLV
jgi:hypothetical protein